ncbi:hypothetical protein CK203_029875 [Vitis vinifera]|uniref:NB-ARC domain-containing protein n=1 Tax=Vitis vinifera TaxID=29760 RepID=A0A438IDF0_VITVI|nr:hypothetical protein CK203_029875 [Vitis vinifera]
MDLLNDDGVRRIGIWVWEGWARLLCVQGGGFERIQTEIAKRLGMEVKKDESIQTLAIQLLQKLRKQDRFLLILDDVGRESIWML